VQGIVKQAKDYAKSLAKLFQASGKLKEAIERARGVLGADRA
jgi:hypothetical protein